MANEEQKYTSEFKTKVASEALEQDKQNLDSLSDKYEVPVSLILTWTAQLQRGGPEVFDTKEKEKKETTSGEYIEDRESVDVEINNEDIANAISYGAMLDNLNYKRLVFWCILGIFLVVIFVIGLMEMYQYNTDVTRERISEQTEYYEVNQLNREAQETLSSFGVVDPEEGIYRIPIDSAMNDIVDRNNNN